MQTTNIKTALKVAELKGFTAAADALFMTQPSVSFQIKQLEKELGFKIFNRSSRQFKTTLTVEGATFLLFASQAVKMLEEGVVEAVEGKG